MSIKKYLRIMHVFLITGMYWNLENAVTEPRAGAPFVGQNVGLLNWSTVLSTFMEITALGTRTHLHLYCTSTHDDCTSTVQA